MSFALSVLILEIPLFKLKTILEGNTVREIERLHHRRIKLHQVESSSEKIPAWRVLKWSCLLPIVVIFFLGAKLGE